VKHAREGKGPVLVEAHTYRIDAHTNADDATRYRDSAEVEAWLGRDPLPRLEKYLRAHDLIDDAFVESLTAEAEAEAATLRAGMNVDRPHDPLDLFRYVFAEQTPQLREQQAQLETELAAEAADTGGH
jgi:pyruvate dehydrogenase E1 component alpha subunit